MSANEIIAEIAKLAAAVQKRILDFLKQQNTTESQTAGAVRYADDAEFEKVADKVFNERSELFRKLGC